jgi:glycosyltransferase involved in cell wall biosynthesis
MIAVVIPCYRVKDQILSVLKGIGPEVSRIYVIDDHCPENSAQWVQRHCRDPRVVTHRNERNLGVGGATLTGFDMALRDGAEIVVKLDGDGQMDPAEIPRLVRPIQEGRADYTKGNRFYSPHSLKGMPFLRMIGNSALSFISKISSGYWRVMDPTNGFVALHTRVLALLPVNKIDRRYFFESDMLFRLNTIRARVLDIPMPARYGSGKSSLRISFVLIPFTLKHLFRTLKRIGYAYFVRDFNVASIQIIGATILLASGLTFGWTEWEYYGTRRQAAPTGTIMLSALMIILGFQLLLSAVSFDIMNEPSDPIHPLLEAGAEKMKMDVVDSIR